MKRHCSNTSRAFTVLELIVTCLVLTAMAAYAFQAGNAWRTRAAIGVSTVQLHSLVAANTAYAADHDGEFCPAMSPDNLTRWHGGRERLNEPFDPALGYLAPYLGASPRLLTCPLLKDYLEESFEQGAGGYGYNAEYIGGTPANHFRGALLAQVPQAGTTVMFATTALAVGGSIQEYPFTEPFFWVDRRGRPQGALQPSTHFRASGKALIAWGDGTVTAELPSPDTGPNFYGGDNRKFGLGWFGPSENNGFWNPAGRTRRAR